MGPNSDGIDEWNLNIKNTNLFTIHRSTKWDPPNSDDIDEMFVQLLETWIAWRQPKQSYKHIVYLIEVQQPEDKREQYLIVQFPSTSAQQPDGNKLAKLGDAETVNH